MSNRSIAIRKLLLLPLVLLTGCGGLGTVCTEMGGVSLITLEAPAGARIAEFCVDGFECATPAVGESVSIGVDDGDRFDYSYSATVQFDNEIVEFVGEVTTEPTYLNGRRCGRTAKVATLVILDSTTVESR